MTSDDEKNLKRSIAQWDEFARLVAHDLKAPIRAISNLAQWVEEDLAPPVKPEITKNLGLLRMRTARLNSLLEALLEYARCGTTDPQLTDIDLNKVLSEIIAAAPARAGLRISIASEPPAFRGAEGPLRQALACLVSNAVLHHDKAEGVIEISALDQGAELEISVKDDGPGIDPKFHEKIFQVFQTLKPRDETGFSGMGLALVKRIAEQQGGRVILESKLGKGSTFRVFLPKK